MFLLRFLKDGGKNNCYYIHVQSVVFLVFTFQRKHIFLHWFIFWKRIWKVYNDAITQWQFPGILNSTQKSIYWLFIFSEALKYCLNLIRQDKGFFYQVKAASQEWGLHIMIAENSAECCQNLNKTKCLAFLRYLHYPATFIIALYGTFISVW